MPEAGKDEEWGGTEPVLTISGGECVIRQAGLQAHGQCGCVVWLEDRTVDWWELYVFPLTNKSHWNLWHNGLMARQIFLHVIAWNLGKWITAAFHLGEVSLSLQSLTWRTWTFTGGEPIHLRVPCQDKSKIVWCYILNLIHNGGCLTIDF